MTAYISINIANSSYIACGWGCTAWKTSSRYSEWSVVWQSRG